MDTDRNGLEVLTREQCLSLLGTTRIGRIALTAAALPVVIPVEFAVDRGSVVFRTGPDTQLAAAARGGAVVAFEADDVEPGVPGGWSVSVTGTAKPVTDPEDLAWLGALPIREWAPNRDADVFIRLLPVLLSGRRFPGARVAASSAGRTTPRLCRVPEPAPPQR